MELRCYFEYSDLVIKLGIALLRMKQDLVVIKEIQDFHIQTFGFLHTFGLQSDALQLDK